jgi:hypothetical protein
LKENNEVIQMKRQVKHETETKYPEQTKAYKEIVHQLYQLHLDKNREYSPNNVKALGTLGLALRMFEKNIRLLNLLGWDAFEGKVTKKVVDPKFGSVEAELVDISNIGILALILSKNKWGH